MHQPHYFASGILREYDIRGVVGQSLDSADARAVGRAFAAIVGAGTQICVGYDGRLSSPELEQALVEGLLDGGLGVECIGLVPTPLLYFATRRAGAKAGIMVTGSHNPPEYNGFKLVTASGPFYGVALQELGRLAEQGVFDHHPVRSEVKRSDPSHEYIGQLLAQYDSPRELTVAWDCGNGATGELVEQLTRILPGRHLLLYTTVDGNFPNHHPDPSVEANLADLADLVRAQGCDVGIGFDGDGDRIGVVDQHGQVLWGDQLLALYAADVLRTNPGASVVADIKVSQAVLDEIARLGGVPVLWQSGHARIRSKMKQTGALLAGEMSGHVFFADSWNGFDDALYAAVRLLNILGRSGESLAALRGRLPEVVNTPEIRFPVAHERKFAVIEEVRQRLIIKSDDDCNILTLDGLRVSTSKGWWLLRASNTQEMLVVRVEASDQKSLTELKNDLAGQLAKSGIEAPIELISK